jgi:5'-3' exonuclease
MRVLLIDGNNFLFAAQHNGTKLSAGSQETTAVHGFLGSLRNVVERFPGSIPVVLWDASPSWRFDLYADYKGNRDKNPALVKVKEALRTQRPIVKDVLTHMGVRQYSIPNQEADDLAGDLSRKFASGGHEVILVTRDGDWQQLVNDKVYWYDHKNDKIIHPGNFHAETGYLDTTRFVHAKAIHGDASDNIPGVGGLGEGAAKLILNDFNSLNHLHFDWLTGLDVTIGKGHPWSRYKKKIQAAFDDYRLWEKYNLNLKLMTLDREYTKDQYRSPSRYDEAALKGLLGRLGFHQILHKYERWFEPLKRGIVE